MRSLDLVVILLYLVAIAAVGLRLSGRQGDARADFIGERDLPWWAICFSIVATETSTLTVISVPGVAYLGAFASVTFLVTRLLAEGVRLFASAILIKLLLDAIGLSASYVAIIAALSAVTVLYTYVGGIRAVIWTDAVQMLLYLSGAVACIAILLGEVGGARLTQAWDAGKVQVLNFTTPVLTSPFNTVVALLATLAVMSFVVRTYPLAFTWYVPLGVIVTLLVGGLLSLRHERARVAA